jgi:hypothetical protein
MWHMLCISKSTADRGKLVPFLESAGQMYPETGLTFEAPKCVLADSTREKIYFVSYELINQISHLYILLLCLDAFTEWNAMTLSL